MATHSNSPRRRKGPKQSAPLSAFLPNLLDVSISPLFVLTVGTLLLSLMLGGASRPGLLSNAILQSVGVVALLAIIPPLAGQQRSVGVNFSLICLAFLVAVPLLQIISIPETVWRMLPGRELFIPFYESIPNLSWPNTWSLSPAATFEGLASLAAPIAIFIGSIMLSFRERRRAIIVLLLFGCGSLLLGLLQLLDGPDSTLYFYDITNNGSFVAFFSNRNHLATLFFCLIPFAIAFLLAQLPEKETTLTKHSRKRHKRPQTKPPIVFSEFSTSRLFLSMLVLIFMLGTSLTNSRAGLGLVLFSITAAVVLCNVGKQRGELAGQRRLLLYLISLSLLIAAYYSLDQYINRLSASDQLGARPQFSLEGWRASMNFFPFGAGVGTFENAFKIFEPASILSPSIVNRVHNEYVEWIFEAGILAIVGLLLVIAWLSAMVYRLWTAGTLEISNSDLMLMRVAGLTPILVLIHSSVDYPLRTGAIAGLTAFCCALTFPPLGTRVLHREKHPAQLAPSTHSPFQPA